MNLIDLGIKLFPSVCSALRWLTRRKPNRGTLLIIEDNANDALILEISLRKLGYDCEIASSGEVAQGLIRRGYFSVIFVDLRLPQLSGEALLRVLSNEVPSSKIVVVCGEPTDLRDIEAGVPIILIKKNVTIAGLTKLFSMLNAE